MDAEAIGSDAFLGDDGAFAENWMDNLPEDTFENDETGKNKTGDLADLPNFPTLVKNHLNLQGKLGTAIFPLGDDASDEERRAHYTKQGCPEKAEGYVTPMPEKLPEGMLFSEDIMTAAKNYAHANGVKKEIFEGLSKVVLDSQIEMFNKMVEQAKKDSDKVAEEATNKLKGKWGADHDKYVEMARRAYDVHGGKEFVDLMESTGLKDNAIVVETFLEIFKQTNPKEFVSGGPETPKETPAGQLDYSNVHGHSGR